MQNRSIVGVLAMVGLITAFAARPSGATFPRKKLTCEEFRHDTERTTKEVFGKPMIFKSGDWGKTPEPLRVLPPKASFCGSWESSAAVASPLTGKEFTAYYTPILQKMGCKDVKCEITEQKTHCSCGVMGGFARIGTEEPTEIYMISFLKMGSH